MPTENYRDMLGIVGLAGLVMMGANDTVVKNLLGERRVLPVRAGRTRKKEVARTRTRVPECTTDRGVPCMRRLCVADADPSSG